MYQGVRRVIAGGVGFGYNPGARDPVTKCE